MGNTARTTNLTVQFWNEQRDILERAAQQAKNRDGSSMNISQWMRSRVIPLACRELGIPTPNFPEFGKRGSESGVYRAASMLGVSVKEFERTAARQVAEALLDAATTPVARSEPPAPIVDFAVLDERRR